MPSAVKVMDGRIKYLFFDIECCNGRDICSFGYAAADADFRMLRQEDLLVNPQAAFELGRAGFDPEIELGYPIAEFERSPVFAERYGEIAGLLTAEGVTVCGHAVHNDAYFLNTACERSGLLCIDFDFIDTQALYKCVTGDKNPKSLEKIAAERALAVSNLHRSDCDAVLTAKVAASICAEKGASLAELAERYPESRGKSEHGDVKVYCADYYRQFSRLADYAEPEKGACNAAVSGRTFAFAEELEHKEPLKMMTALKLLSSAGGRYTKNADRADVFVRYGESRSRRLGRILTLRRQGLCRTSVITTDEFAKRLKTKWEDVPSSEPVWFVPYRRNRERSFSGGTATGTVAELVTEKRGGGRRRRPDARKK